MVHQLSVDRRRAGTHSAASSTGSWTLPTRLTFRFFLVYFLLFCLFTQVIWGVIGLQRYLDPPPDLAAHPPMRTLADWAAAHVFRARTPVSHAPTGSGDRLADWLTVFCVFGVAVVGAVLWSVLDRRRRRYDLAYQWLRVFLRFALAGQMFVYGLVKVFLIQMPLPLMRLVEPFGDFSPMSVLWTQVGASRPYEILTGCAELLGGALLVVPVTATLGAVIVAADMVQVFVLNMAYDVPVKLLSFHLLVMSLFLLAPDARRLLAVVALGRGAGPSPTLRYPRTVRMRRLALVAQLVLGAWIFGWILDDVLRAWHQVGPARPKPALYGIWAVDRFSQDGRDRPPLTTDAQRWQRLIVDMPGTALYQRMDGSFGGYAAVVDRTAATLTLRQPGPGRPAESTLRFHRQPGDRLELDGTLDGRPTVIELHRQPVESFPLRQRAFHWVSPVPYQR